VSLDPIRQRLQQLAADNDRSLAWLSYLIGRDETYLPQYVDEGQPATLPSFDRRLLATYFDIDERDLAGSADMA
jgi:hypothetical protein